MSIPYPLKANFIYGYSGATISEAAGAVTVNAGNNLPIITGTFVMAIWDATTYPNPNFDPNLEMVDAVYSGTANTYTITRAQQSTSAHVHAAGSKCGVLDLTPATTPTPAIDPVVLQDLTEKTTLVDDDLFLIADSADDYTRKKVKKVNVGGGGGVGDMTKAVYDVGNTGRVDKATTVNDGTNISTAADVKDAVTKKHTQGSDTTLGTMAANINMGTHKLTALSVPSSTGESVRTTAKITESNLEDAVDKKHTQQHSITSTSDHTSTATSGKMLKADTSGLPVDGTNTDAEVASAVSLKHTQGSDTTLGTMTADINMNNSYQVTNLAAPAANGEAIRQTATITEASLTAAIAGGGASFLVMQVFN